MRLHEYRYRLIQQHATSDKYGPCEICGKFVIDMYSQSEEQRFTIGDAGDNGDHWSHNGFAFGHKECLLGLRNTGE